MQGLCESCSNYKKCSASDYGVNFIRSVMMYKNGNGSYESLENMIMLEIGIRGFCVTELSDFCESIGKQCRFIN